MAQGLNQDVSCVMDSSIFGCDDIFDLFDSIFDQLLLRYGTKSIRHKFIYTLTGIKLYVLQCF